MKTIYAIAAAVLLLTGCKSYSITTDSLVQQLKQDQHPAPDPKFEKYAMFKYSSNHLKKIQCVDSKGDTAWVTPGKNTGLQITQKSTGKKYMMYFDTVILENDTIYGLKSRLIGVLRAFPVNDIDKVVVSN